MSGKSKIFVGIGGWNFAPWRGAFYPKGLVQTKELAYASAHLTSIEINSTFYGSQKPETFRKWARETPDGFVFSVKGPRFATNRRVLAEAGDSIKRFFASGVLELGDRLGPFLWQFTPTKKFDEPDFGAFLKLLPTKIGGKALRHVVEVRHESFCDPSFIALLRQSPSSSPNTRPIPPSPISPAISSTHGCKRERIRLRPAIRLQHLINGPIGLACGRKAARPRISRTSIRKQLPPRRATSSSISSTKGKFARRPPPWR
jgi:uncharacterized protein YecE (DUF72 family)